MAYNVKFLKGTEATYGNITPDALTFYYTTDQHNLYLGSVKLSNAAELDAAVLNIAANSEEISKIKTALGSLTGQAFNDLLARVAVNEGAISDLQGDVEALEGSVTSHGTRITDVEAKAKKNSEDLTQLTADFGLVAADYASKGDLEAVAGDVADNAAAIAVLNGQGEGSVHQQVADAIAEVVADAPAEFDTLKEVADWIGKDTTGAAQMQIDIADLKTTTADHETRLVAAEGDIDTLQTKMTAVETLAAANDAAHKKNAQDIADAVAEIGKSNEAIAKNAEDITKEYNRAKGEEDAIKSRLDAVEEMTGVSGSQGNIASQIATAKSEAISEAKTYTDGQISSLSSSVASDISTAKQEAIDAAASSAAELYATKAQGALADTALQKADIATGAVNGTISVDGSDVAVKGLGTAAYKNETDFEVAGAKDQAIEAAKKYSDSLAKNYDVSGSAAAAEANAKTYVDTALTWGEIQ